MSHLELFIEHKKGKLPIIISVPHGGTLRVDSIPDRPKGILGTDKATIPLAKAIISYIKQMSNVEPSYVISKVHRCKIDLNRNESESYPINSQIAKKIYQLYHKKILEIIKHNLESFDYSLLIDIHGFEKDKRPKGYMDVELVLGTNNLSSLSSELVPVIKRESNIRGKIIKKFLELNIPIAPIHPHGKEYILTGGYIIQQYGAAKIPKSQAIQIEFSDNIRINNPPLKYKVLKALSEVLLSEIY